MNNYVIRKKAVKDLESIWIYTFENWSEKQADRYYQLIIEEIEYISKNKDSGKSAMHIKKGYRYSKVKSHLIFYRLNRFEQVEIVRILHQSMDIDSKF
jgi:toxin ParE1/3/4